ncbi:unnamed protein product [Mycena citricolor]|uniref:Lysophospholipase n=1 Tax=Mycena citricolor TaxID=2018698 RepID=A0AAD2Q6G4_9AGAR|nr:unnamed protein product [Mycena citricolor]
MTKSRPVWRCVGLALLLTSTSAQITLPSQDNVTDYAPSVNVQCPDFSTTNLVREFTPQNQTLHPAEIEFVNKRLNTTVQDAWYAWLNGSALGYNISAFTYGAGCLSALDARNESSKAAGTGGLLQAASYITGLSGGSWVTGSLLFNNWPTIKDLIYGNDSLGLDGWKLDLPFASPDGLDVFSQNNQYFYGSILWSVFSKAATGVDTSISDPWSRMISYHFLNQTTRSNFFTNKTAHGAGQLWSDIPNIPAVQQGLAPFPILVTDSRPASLNTTVALTLDPTVYEISPFEFASYDPNLSAGMNLTYAGTHLTNGKAANGSACVTGFDQAGFMMGTSASLFNQIFDFANNELQGFDSADSHTFIYLLQRQLRSVRTRQDDVANWPNPFNGLKSATYDDSSSTWLSLIDGASNGENIPYGPLFVKARALDVIVTLENSADDPNTWPKYVSSLKCLVLSYEPGSGSSVLTTSQRLSTILRASHQQFPPIPQSANDFISTGVRQRPTFFGCDPSQTPPEYPLVIYLPNSPPITGDDPVTNSATFKLSYPSLHTRLFLDQVHLNTISGFTPNANTPDPNFGLCLQCASIDRSRMKISPTPSRSEICAQCFKQYCYDPQNPPSVSELPNRKLVFKDPTPEGLSKITGFLGTNKLKLVGGAVGLFVFIVVLCVSLIWWKRRKDRKIQYSQVSNFHEDDGDSTRLWRRSHQPYSDYHAEQYELPTQSGHKRPGSLSTLT